MKIIYVAGGSYKSFYLNYFLRLRKCDLLIFNFGILYDYHISKEKTNLGVVSKEILDLANHLKCVVLAGVNLVEKNKKTKSILLCDGKRITIKPAIKGIKFSIKNNLFLAGEKNTEYKNCNKIVFTNSRITPNLERCNKHKFYLFCDNLGVCFISNKKLIRKFNKYSKFILK